MQFQKNRNWQSYIKAELPTRITFGFMQFLSIPTGLGLIRRVARSELPLFNTDTDSMKLKLLIIEDEPEVAELIVWALDAYECEAVHNLASAGKHLTNHCDFKLIISDLSLPDSVAHETIGRLREMTDLPVIVFSGFLNNELATLCRRQGATACIPKTGNIGSPHRLRATVDCVVRRSGELVNYYQVRRSMRNLMQEGAYA